MRNPNAPAVIRTMPSRFDNTCRVCGAPIYRGDVIMWNSQNGYVFHTDCSPLLSPKNKFMSDAKYAKAVATNKASGKAQRELLKAEEAYEAAKLRLMAARAQFGVA